MQGLGDFTPYQEKMNRSNGRMSAGKKFDASHIFGDPFALATLGIAIVSEQGRDDIEILTR